MSEPRTPSLGGEPAAPPEALVTDRIQVASRCRPAHGQKACGDALEIFHSNVALTAVVVDGLGHGPDAELAAQTALSHVRSQLASRPDRPIEELMQGCHRALAGTRGAAVALCRLEPDRGRMLFCGVGNVGMRSHPDHRGLGISLPGVVGYRMRRVRVFESELCAGDLVTIFTDGISSRFPLGALASLPVEELVARVEAEHGKAHDDATLVALRVAATNGGGRP